MGIYVYAFLHMGKIQEKLQYVMYNWTFNWCTTDKMGWFFFKIFDIHFSPANVHEICGTFRDCEGRDDGRYPDVDRKCQYYFTCYARKFMGHNPCPAGLVFNFALQTCDYITDIGPPCGINPNMTSSPLELLGWSLLSADDERVNNTRLIGD